MIESRYLVDFPIRLDDPGEESSSGANKHSLRQCGVPVIDHGGLSVLIALIQPTQI